MNQPYPPAGPVWGPRAGSPPYWTPAPPPSNRPSVTGLITSAAGAALAVAGFLTAWYSANGADLMLSDIAHAVKPATAAGLPHAWFGWGIWVVFALTAVTAFAAVIPSVVSPLLRVLAPIFGLAGAALTYAALATLRDGTDLGVFDHAATGLWLTLIGFVVLGIGGALGASARAKTSPTYGAGPYGPPSYGG